MSNKPKALNKEQLQAVHHKKGPLLIIAGAGTGKTTVITERIKFLIEKEYAEPSEILALTFTEKAAKEMETRVDEALPYGYTQMWIMTFHSFCDRVLKSEALHIGLSPKYKLASDAVATQMLRDNLFKLKLDYFRPLGNPTKFISGMLQHFSRLQDEDIAPADYAKWVDLKKKTKGLAKEEKLEIKKWLELSRAYRAYNELKVKSEILDFGDLIMCALDLFQRRPNILKEYRDKFKYILIDEFQDTNIAQNELVKLLAGKDGNITVVADDDQAIYRFRGASVSNVIQFRHTFPKSKLVSLTKNYRSTQEVLDRAHELIVHNNPDRLEVLEKIDKKLVSARKIKGEEIEFIHVDRVENEAQAVGQEIENIKKFGNYNWKDFAILVRANNHAEPFTRALARLGIPYQFLGPGRLFKQPEVIDLVSYLKVLVDPDDSISFLRILSLDYFDVSPRDIIKIGNWAKRQNMSLYEACRKTKGIPVSVNSKRKIKKLLKVINSQLKRVYKDTSGQLLYDFLTEVGLLQEIINPDTAGAQKVAANISKFFDKLKSYEVSHEDATPPAVVDWIDLSAELGESPLATDTDWDSVDAVNILTVHSAKGLEFPVVFLVNLVAQRFPTTERREQIPIPDSLIKEILPKGDYHLEEERRLFYVGMTRARDRLFLTAADFYGEGKREKKLSPFIFETLGGDVDGKQEAIKSKQLSFLDYKPADQLVGRPIDLLKLNIDFLSYSQIETFKTCPLHYKLKYIYKIPTPLSASLSFGIAMHSALNNFYDLVSGGEKPSEKLIHRLLKESWINEGFRSKSHEKKFFEKGKTYLSGFLKEGFDPGVTTLKLEEPFLLPLPAKKGERPLKIGGKIDRVDRFGSGIEIIDYKTGATVPSQKDVDKNLQLSFYALAARILREQPFGVGEDKIKLSLYYLDTQEKISTTRTKADLDKAVEEIYKTRREIEESDFKCSGNYLCGNCEYKLFCGSDSE